MRTALVCLAVNFIGNLIFIPIYSWRAAAVVTIVTEIVLLAQNVYWIRRAVGKVAIPWAMARTSLAFFVLLGGSLAGGLFAPPLVMGGASIGLFGIYLCCSGHLSEIQAVWEA